MAGRGQHFIPQHFQKPFVTSNGKDQLWMYRRGLNKAIAVSRGDAAKQRDFYSQPAIDSSKSLDDLITDYENSLSLMVDKVRELKCGQEIPAETIAEIAVHLSVRAASIRNMFTETIETLLERFSDLFHDPEKFLGVGMSTAPPKLEELLFKQFEDLDWFQKSEVYRQTIARVGYLLLREKKTEIYENVSDFISHIQTDPQAKPERISAGAHKNILNNELAPKARIDNLSQFTWRVVAHDNEPAILPDCVCFALEQDDLIKPLISSNIDKTKIVIIPLSPSTLAIGKRDECSLFDLASYNRLAVNSCFDFYLASENVPELLKFLPELGGHLRNDINELVNHAMSSSEWGVLSDEQTGKAVGIDNFTDQLQPQEKDDPVPLSLRFIGVINQDTAQLITQHVCHLVDKFLSSNVTKFLDGLTFSNEYETELANLGYCVEQSGNFQSSQSSVDEGAAIAIPVVRDGKYKVRIIVRDYIGNLLLSEKEEDYSLAISAIQHALASAEFLYIQSKKFPDQVLVPIADPLEKFLHRYSGGVFPAYYIQRIANYSGVTIEEQEAELVGKINNYSQEIVEKRRAYRVDGILDDFFLLAVYRASDLLDSFAKLYASKSFLEPELSMSKELLNTLSKYDLVNWAHLFREDLKIFYDRLSIWSDYKQLFFVNRHLERWLLIFGVLVELQGEGQIHLHVPIGSDVEYLTSLQSLGGNHQ